MGLEKSLVSERKEPWLYRNSDMGAKVVNTELSIVAK